MKEKRSELLAFRTTESMKKFLDDLSEEHARPVSDVINLLLQFFKENPPERLPVPKKKKFVYLRAERKKKDEKYQKVDSIGMYFIFSGLISFFVLAYFIENVRILAISMVVMAIGCGFWTYNGLVLRRIVFWQNQYSISGKTNYTEGTAAVIIGIFFLIFCVGLFAEAIILMVRGSLSF